MNAAGRVERLQAMGLTVWRLRAGSGQLDAPACGIAVEGSGGRILMLCADSGEATRPLARDLARALPGAAWGWPDVHGAGIDETVSEQLLSHVLVFGRPVAERVFDGTAPERAGGASVVLLPSLDELADSGAARRAAWARFVELGLAARS
ncbi:MAG: hypothetical protein R3233_03780 [Xanthomonadales bacterium]|nr:hypothetical protein [Xanthomonadales bacterium]